MFVLALDDLYYVEPALRLDYSAYAVCPEHEGGVLEPLVPYEVTCRVGLAYKAGSGRHGPGFFRGILEFIDGRSRAKRRVEGRNLLPRGRLALFKNHAAPEPRLYVIERGYFFFFYVVHPYYMITVLCLYDSARLALFKRHRGVFKRLHHHARGKPSEVAALFRGTGVVGIFGRER